MKLKLTPKTIIIMVAVIVLLVSGGFYLIYSMAAGDSSPAVADSGQVNAAVSDGFEATYDVGTLTVNLDAGGLAIRFLRADIVLQVDSEETVAELEKRSPQVRDSIISLLRSKIRTDFDGEGFEQVREEITTRVNSFLSKGRVIKSFFNEFVIQ